MKKGYSICYNEWALDPKIKTELGLLCIISSLSAKEGYCYASNSFLGNLFGIAPETMSRKISKLVKLGYLKSEMVMKPDSKEVEERRITPLTKTSVPLDDSVNTPLNKKVKGNITKSNTTIVKRKIEVPIVPEFPLWSELWTEWIEYRKREKKPKFRSIETEQIAFNKLYKLANGNIETARLIVEQSISNGYTGLFKINNRNGNKSNQEKLAGY